MIFRDTFCPWGEINWILDKLPKAQWDLLACLSTEERCLATFKELQNRASISSALFYEIVDPVDTTEHQRLRLANRVSINNSGITSNFETHLLLEPLSNIVESIHALIEKSSDNIIIDISSFPKRFFFPIVKFILRLSKPKNIIITYSAPEKYTNENLSENPQSWFNIPSFKAEDDDVDVAIVGVGFMPLGLPDFLNNDNHPNLKVSLLLPFPPGPPAYQRTWNFVKEISENRTIDPQALIRLDAVGVPEIFERICAITNYGSKKVLFAPYGPKPISLAMCLYACQTDSSVYYTQPTSYHPVYCEGVSQTFAYCIRLENRNLFKIESNDGNS